MKVTCIVGSARTNGSSAFIVDSFIKGVRENNSDIEIKNIISHHQISLIAAAVRNAVKPEYAFKMTMLK